MSKLQLVAYAGGRKHVLVNLLARIPKHEIYVEVFGGMANLLLNKPPCKVEVYNDIDSRLVNMFRQIRNHPEWFEEQIKYIPYSYELYKEYLDTLDSKELDDREKALRFLYCIASSFNGEIQTKSWKVHKYVALPTVWNHKSLIIRQIAKRLMTVYIDHDDFRKVIKRWDSKNTLFFCDPPYYKAEKMYTYGFTEFDHVALKNILSTIRGKFLLIYDDCKEIRDMYKDFIIEQISAKIYMQKIVGEERTTKDYLLIRNYTLEKKVSEFGTQH